MAVLTWDDIGERVYETGVSKGVLYIPDENGDYTDGVAWNGLTNVTESPSGAESNAQYADNLKYLDLRSAEEFGGTIEAFTYPDEFNQFDGAAIAKPGVVVGQQARKTFGLSYRTEIGNDVDGDEYGYKLHLVYGCTASPSERAYSTINDSPEAATFSWEFTTLPVSVNGLRSSSLITIDSTKVANPANLAALEQFLYGTAGTDPSLPMPDAVIALFDSPQQIVLTAPTAVGNTITINEDAGVDWYANGSMVTLDGDGSTDLVITEDTLIEARAKTGYFFAPTADTTWFFEHT